MIGVLTPLEVLTPLQRGEYGHPSSTKAGPQLYSEILLDTTRVHDAILFLRSGNFAANLPKRIQSV